MQDLSNYLKRICLEDRLDNSSESLAKLHLAHATHIPFENLDVLLKRPIRLDLESLSRKLIHDRRGGYCFEQNTLFALVLEKLGFSVKRLAARVRMGTTEPRPRTHTVLLVEADGERWLADVGFGGEGLLQPLRFRLNDVADSFGWKYRLAEQGGLYVLQSRHAEGWYDLYAFNLEEQLPIDYELANYFTSTHPQSHFTYMLLAQLPGTERRRRLTNRRFSVETPAGMIEEREIASDDELLEILATQFGLEFPKGTQFPIAST